MRDLVVVGAGGFGRESIDVVRAINALSPTWDLVGVVDDRPAPANLARLERLGVPHLGGLEAIPAEVAVAVAVGSPTARRRIIDSLTAGSHDFPALVHPSTVTGSELHHGPGLIVLGGVSIGTNVTLGDHVHLNAHAVIGHDTRCGDFVSVNPNATVSGECSIGSATLLGAGSTVLQQLTIGADVTVGAASCVTHNLPDDCTVVGVPARPLTKDSSA